MQIDIMICIDLFAKQWREYTESEWAKWINVTHGEQKEAQSSSREDYWVLDGRPRMPMWPHCRN